MSGIEWRYLHERATAKHALGSPTAAIAACGTTHQWFAGSSEWRGTGSQHEYERAAELPECKRCLKALSSR